MRERALLIGAELTVRDGRGGGTEVRLDTTAATGARTEAENDRERGRRDRGHLRRGTP